MGCEWSARRQSANNPADQQLLAVEYQGRLESGWSHSGN
jgi:hypothetical protein